MENNVNQELSENELYSSPFQYQLLNSYIINEIESTLGRKLEATDIFYEVIDKSGLQENETYIYNKKEKIKFVVDKSKLNRTKAVWYWLNDEGKPYFTDETKKIQLLDFLKNEKVTDIYISSIEDQEESDLRDFIRKAYERGIVVEFLSGDPQYISEYNRNEKITKKIEFLTNYNNKSNYNEKIKGIHYDIEIYTNHNIYYDEEHTLLMPEWKNSNSEEEKNSDRKKYYVSFVEEAYKQAKSNNLTIAFDVSPMQFVSTIVNYNGSEKTLMEYVMSNSDYCSAMAYKNDVIKLFRYICLPSNTEYDSETGKILYTSNLKQFSDGTLRGTDTIIALAKKYKKNIVIGLSIADSGVDNFSELGKEKMNEIVNEFSELISDKNKDIVVEGNSLKGRSNEKCGYEIEDFDNFGFSYHNCISYLKMN